MMELLINEHHADTHCRDIFGHTLLHATCYGSTSEATLDYLLTNHPELHINIRDGYGQTPLFPACEFGSPVVVKRLLREKKDSADVLAVDERGMNTPLLKACISGRADNIRILLASQPPEIQQEMLSGQSIFQTPLDRCCDTRCPNSAALEAVLEFNPPPYNICVTLEQVLSRRSESEKYQELFDILLRHTQESHRKDTSAGLKNSYLHLAAMRGNRALVDLFFVDGRDLWKTNHAGHTATEVAGLYEYVAIEEYLGRQQAECILSLLYYLSTNDWFNKHSCRNKLLRNQPFRERILNEAR